MADVVAARPAPWYRRPGRVVARDLTPGGVAEKLVAGRPEVIFHAVGVVSEAEFEFDKDHCSDGMRVLLEAIRRAGGGFRPKRSHLLLSAARGRTPSAKFQRRPRTSYGAQKAICELPLADSMRLRFCR